jgi:hypothetical protein
MSNRDLADLGAWCCAKATEQERPEGERRLWIQIADEISDYLEPSEALFPDVDAFVLFGES